MDTMNWCRLGPVRRRCKKMRAKPRRRERKPLRVFMQDNECLLRCVVSERLQSPNKPLRTVVSFIPAEFNSYCFVKSFIGLYTCINLVAHMVIILMEEVRQNAVQCIEVKRLCLFIIRKYGEHPYTATCW